MKKIYLGIITMIMLSVLSFLSFADKTLTTFEVGDLIQFGTYNEEPISWVVLEVDESGDVAVVSENIIAIKPFNASGDTSEKDDYYSYAFHYGSNNWATSTLRIWLNATDDKIDWDGNVPNENNVFNGENDYDKEPGFLSKQNFTSEEVKRIKRTVYESNRKESLNDQVYILTINEINELTQNAIFYPMMLPTVGCFQQSEYKGFDLKMGNPFWVWTRDGSENPYAPHAVNTINAEGKESVGVASAGRAGVMPAMTLDGHLLLSGEVFGDGSGSNPYRFAFKKELEIVNWLSIFVMISAPCVLMFYFIKRYKALRVKKYISQMVVFMVLLPLLALLIRPVFAMTQESSDGDYLIMQNYALNQALIFKRIDTLYEHRKGIIVDAHGTDVTDAFLEAFKTDGKTVDREKFLEALSVEPFYLLYPGDFRVTNLENEVKGVIEGTHYVVHVDEAEVGYQMLDSKLLTETFKSDIKAFYDAKDYDAIWAYLNERELWIRHPSDTSNTGIPLLFYDGEN